MHGPPKYGKMVLDLPESHKNIARYIWSVFTEATNFRLSDFPDAPFVINTTGGFPISESFRDILDGNIVRIAHRYNLPQGLEEFRKNEAPACAFYLINNLHETLLPPGKLDKYGRYPYAESIQYANDLMEVNYVQDIFDAIYRDLTDKTPVREESTLLWTHDIDYLFSAWKSDLILALRESRYFDLPKILYRALTTSHRWDNIDEILQLEKEYDIRSVFFWLTEQGKSQVTPSHSIDHADYHFQMKRLLRYWEKIEDTGSVHGLHKSAFPGNMDTELHKLPRRTHINRNHFLKFRLPDHYDQVEKAGLKYDASLGFPEHFGFRNSFGRPFRPYNLPENRPFRFTEFPLHLMDTTFLTYLNLDLESMADGMIDFIHRHPHSCTISILLHNSYFDFGNREEIKIWKRLFDVVTAREYTLPGKK